MAVADRAKAVEVVLVASGLRALFRSRQAGRYRSPLDLAARVELQETLARTVATHLSVRKRPLAVAVEVAERAYLTARMEDQAAAALAVFRH